MLHVSCFVNMNKDQLIETVSKKAGCSKKEVGEIVEAVLDNISKALQKGEKVVLTGFGAFSVSSRAARAGVNPKTGARIQIPAMKVPKFKAGKALKEAVK